MALDIVSEVRQNARDISTLANTVTELATIVKLTEKAHEDDRRDMRELVHGLKELNEKIGSVACVQKEIGTLAIEVGKFRHDLRNLENSILAIPLLKNEQVKSEKLISDHETRINMLEKWKDNTDGATGAVKVVIHTIWAFVSIGGLGFIAWLSRGYFGGGGGISGE